MRLYDWEHVVTIGNRNINMPSQCEECGGRTFRVYDDASTFVDVQVIEIVDINDLRNGEIYSTTALLKGNLVDNVTWGDLVEIKGFIETNKYMGKYFNFFNVKTINKVPKSKSNVEISVNDGKIIKKLSKIPEIFDILVKSFASPVRGLWDIKEAIILQLFSIGSETEFKSETYLGSPNILLVDENGVVNQILKFAARMAPTGIFLDGRKPSPIVPKAETKFRRHMVESGVLILADEGILCIDQINSISYGKDDIKIAMEAQVISVKIGGCPISTLPAKTTMLAGISQKRELSQNSPVDKQISMKPDLFFEFDLVFRSNDENYYSPYNNPLNFNKGYMDSSNTRLRESVIRKYISYTNRLNPRIVDENVNKYLLSFFLDLRENFGSYLIDQKKFNSVIELAKASARIHLREEIAIEDAERAIKVYKNSLKSIGIDLGSDHPNIRMIMPRQDINKNKKLLKKIHKDIIKNEGKISFNRLVEVMRKKSNLEEGLIRILVADEYKFVK
jgi:DNA replicative helicase MCM subunit Mcm2 (Cdc46/Mcm family)